MGEGNLLIIKLESFGRVHQMRWKGSRHLLVQFAAGRVVKQITTWMSPIQLGSVIDEHNDAVALEPNTLMLRLNDVVFGQYFSLHVQVGFFPIGSDPAHGITLDVLD